MCGLLFVVVRVFCAGCACLFCGEDRTHDLACDRQTGFVPVSYTLSPIDSCYFEIESQSPVVLLQTERNWDCSRCHHT